MKDTIMRAIIMSILLLYFAPLFAVLMVIAVLFSIVNIVRKYTTIEEEKEMYDELFYIGYTTFKNFVENGELTMREEEL